MWLNSLLGWENSRVDTYFQLSVFLCHLCFSLALLFSWCIKFHVSVFGCTRCGSWLVIRFIRRPYVEWQSAHLVLFIAWVVLVFRLSHRSVVVRLWFNLSILFHIIFNSHLCLIASGQYQLTLTNSEGLHERVERCVCDSCIHVLDSWLVSVEAFAQFIYYYFLFIYLFFYYCVSVSRICGPLSTPSRNSQVTAVIMLWLVQCAVLDMTAWCYCDCHSRFCYASPLLAVNQFTQQSP